MKLNFENFFECGFSCGELEREGKKLPKFLESIGKKEAGFSEIFAPKDFAALAKIKDFATHARQNFDRVVFCGMGGSILGGQFLVESLGKKSGGVAVDFWQNTDPDSAAAIFSPPFCRTLFVFTSKSGQTLETISQYFLVRDFLEKNEKNWREHVAIVSGKTGFLWSESQKWELPFFEIPPKVGGRFSALTPVGLVPAAIAGAEISEILEGGAQMAELFLNKNFEQNMPFQLAAAQILSQKKTQVLMIYSEKMRKFGDWFCQLLAESTGKVDANGQNKGLTPIAATGARDQHSLLQLFLEGPPDKLVILLKIQSFPDPVKIPKIVDPEFAHLSEQTLQSVFQSELRATAEVLTATARPNFSVQIPEISAENVGKLIVLFEGATAFVGEFLGVNVFDQPAVEAGKARAKAILGARKNVSGK